MTRIILDSSACNRLQGIAGLAELCDEQGQIIGYFLSGDQRPGQPPPGFDSSLSREEIERRRSTRAGRTTTEILRSLGLSC